MEKAIVFGAGLSGLGAEKLLKKKGYEVFLIDDRTGMPSSEGIDILEREKVEFVVKSPGIPWNCEFLKKASEKNVKVISEIDLAYRYMDKKIKIISFTGTNGKTTTATKMYELLDYAGYRVRLAGNAGFSFAELVAEEAMLDYIVLELSSYQLENNPSVNSKIAGIINLTPDHLSRYESVEQYYVTKFNIFQNQSEDDFAIINIDDAKFLELFNKNEIKEKIKGKKIYVSKEKKGGIFVYKGCIRVMKELSEKADIYTEEALAELSEELLSVKELSLKGDHNLENMLFVIGAGKLLNIENEKIREFLRNTGALEHRLENFFVKGNTVFINDSKGTNVESTLKAIDSFENSIVLICGGDDKKISNKGLVEKIKERVESVYLIGENAPLLIKDMEEAGYKNFKNMETLENILKNFKENMDFSKSQTVLFSPATSSFCQFKNFEERGRVFKDLTVEILNDND